ncbi:PIN domain-containing protein [Marinobacter salarius]|uniref:PIN domain-containing protein n=1 Tax=Marinobacter salarius TaxID=1420917 RepID=UPI0018F11668|nr:PIN domain-containing protein [Marinobacter salarius]MBJ7277438.1 PIN domain-containing protein [Marinobacter salarius]
MKVLLDTNVVLTGALNPYGPARQLKKLVSQTDFLVSERVLNECDWNIDRKAPGQIIAQTAKTLFRRYLSDLNATVVTDVTTSRSDCYDPDDQIILDTATANKCSAVCTYNTRDFPFDGIACVIPFQLLKQQESPQVHNYVQYPLLCERGTLLFMGQLHHRSSMGTILRSCDSTQIFTDKDGYIRASGQNVQQVNVKAPLIGSETLVLVIRYKPGFFEAARWRIVSGAWSKQILTTGKCNLSSKTTPALFFEKDHRFSATVQNVSGIPTFAREKNLAHALTSGSMEAATGSLDLRYVLQHASFQKGESGYCVTFPIKR